MSVAEQHDRSQEVPFPVTTDAAEWTAEFKAADIPASAYERARHALLDVIGCAIAGRKEPLSGILCDEFLDDAGGPCTVIASGQRARLHDAALINGAMMHALDYDDVNRRLHGHPTTCIAPAVFALAELLGSSGEDVLTSFVIGTEVACALGEMGDEGHYESGFHATGTMGTFGAAAACARLMGLDAAATASALGLAASQASGLKVNFGTMTKPFHAGKAAMNGMLAARLAARGFTASDQAIEGANGFAQAQSPGFNDGPLRPRADAPFAVEQMLFKYHAACYLTHSTLNAIRELRERNDVTLDDVESATLRIRPTHLSVCCIPEPATGLEIKFSIAHLAAMGLDGADTASLGTYSDANATDPRYVEARRHMKLDPQADMERMKAQVSIQLKNGQTLTAMGDVGVPAEDSQDQWRRLSEKFTSLANPVIGEDRTKAAIDCIASLEKEADVGPLMKAVG
ncbi:MAG: MmgE/PrpD family protein [Hyphomicrobiaceae bacterium]|nr:MmgE/PrpD family protein [Hyphomicrobiaceae bacterium]